MDTFDATKIDHLKWKQINWTYHSRTYQNKEGFVVTIPTNDWIYLTKEYNGAIGYEAPIVLAKPKK